MISLSIPTLEEAEKKAVLETLESGWITMGEKVKKFEYQFAEMHGFKDAVAVNSCSSGLHLALAALGIGKGDEVLVPSLTFVATINAIKYVGAEPVFVDIESVLKPHISLSDAKNKITDKTAAVMIMHYGGYLCDVKAWRKFVDDHGLKLVEDAAHAPLCKGVAKQADVTSFSFFSNKNMTTCEGGMLLTDSNEILDRMRNLRSHGMTSVTLDRHKGHAYSYDVVGLGFNYRLDEIRASIGLVQLGKLSEWNNKRNSLSEEYREILQKNQLGIDLPFQSVSEETTVSHLLSILLPESCNREKVMDFMRLNEVQTSIHYPPVHKFTHYEKLYPNIILPNTEEYCARELSLPLHPQLTKNDIEKVCSALFGSFE